MFLLVSYFTVLNFEYFCDNTVSGADNFFVFFVLSSEGLQLHLCCFFFVLVFNYVHTATEIECYIL